MATATWTGGAIWGGASNSATWSGGSGANGAPAAGDGVVIGLSGSLTLGASTPTFASIQINSGSTLAGGGGFAIGTTGGMTNNGVLAAQSGVLTVNSTISGAGSLEAGTATGTAGTMVLNAASSAGALTFANTSGASGSKLEIGATGSLAITGGAPTAVGAYNLQLNGANSSFTNADGVTVGAGTISGQGQIASTITATGAAHVTESGGKLEITGAVTGSSLVLGVGSTASDKLLLDASGNSVGSVSFASATGAGTLELSAGATVTATSALALGSNIIKLDAATSKLTDAAGITVSSGEITGLGTVDAAITASGAAKIAETGGGGLEVTGKISGGATTLGIGATSSDRLLLDAASSAVSTASFASATGAGTLEIGASGSLTVTNSLAVGSNTVQLDGADTVQLTDSSGITLAAGMISGTGTIGATTTISGYGAVAVDLTSGAGAITANGGTLDLVNGYNSNRQLAIGTTAGSLLEIGDTASSGAITINNANQTLQIDNYLTITASETITNGTIALNFGNLYLPTGETLTVGAGATISGTGNLGTPGINATIAGTGTIQAGGSLNVWAHLSGSLALSVGYLDSLFIQTSSVAKSVTFTSVDGSLYISGASLALSTQATVTANNGINLNGGLSTFTDTAGLVLAGGSIGGAGAIASGTAITGSSGTIAANYGGALQVDSAVSGTLALAVGAVSRVGSASTLQLDAASSAASATFFGTGGILDLASGSSLTLTSQMQIGTGNALQLAGTGVQFTDAAGLVLAGGSVSGTGTLASGAAISGYGVVNVAVTGNAIDAVGGALEIAGILTSPASLTIGSGGTLKLDHALTTSSIAVSGPTGGLELASGVTLTLSSALALGANRLQLDGATSNLIDAAGVTLTTGEISGDGVVTGPVTSLLSGTINETGAATLEITGDIAATGGGSNGVSLDVGALASDDLKLDGATNSANTLDFTGLGTLTLASGAALNILNQTVGSGQIQLLGSGVQFTDTAGVVLSGGTISGTGSLSATTAISGHGLVSAPVTGNAIDAESGKLEFGSTVTNAAGLTIGNGATLQLDSTSSAASATFTGPTGVLAIASGGALTDGAELTVNSGETLQLNGTGVQFTDTAGGLSLAGGAVSGAGAVASGTQFYGYGVVNVAVNGNYITAIGGALDFTNTVTFASEMFIYSGSTLQLGGVANTSAVIFAGSTGTLDVGATGSLSVGGFVDLSAGQVLQDDGTFSGLGGVTLAGGIIQGAGTITASTGITGWGTVALSLTAGAGGIYAAGAGTNIVLDLTGTVSGRTLGFTGLTTSTLKLDGATTSTAIGISSANQTLEIGATGSLTFTTAESLANGAIQLDGGILNFSSAEDLTIGAGATLRGSGSLGSNASLVISGTVNANVAGTILTLATGNSIANSGILEAQGGDLKVSDAVTGGGSALVSGGGAMSFAAAFNQNVAFLGANAGTLSLAQTYGGMISGFASGDTIDLTSTIFAATYQAYYYAGAGGGTLEIVDAGNGGAVVATLNFTGSLAGETFSFSRDANGGTIVALASAPWANPQAGDVLVANVSGQSYSAYQNDYSAGGDLVGVHFYYTNVANQPYTSFESDYNGGGKLTRSVFYGITGVGYSTYEYDYVGGVYIGAKYDYTTVPNSATYSSYVLDANYAGAFAGVQYFFTNVQNASYTGEEIDLNQNGQETRLVLTGFQGVGYSSLEFDYAAGVETGFKVFIPGGAGQNYATLEEDYDASDNLQKVIYSGMTGTPFSSEEEDFAGGALTAAVYSFTDVTGANYYAYQQTDNASGVLMQETVDYNSGVHTIQAFVGGQTLTSLGNDGMTGSGATNFVLNAPYGPETITNFAAGDTISLPLAEFANFTAVMNAAQNVGASVVVTATDGETLTLRNMTTTTLATMGGSFTFHA